jgi:hypothetical protein
MENLMMSVHYLSLDKRSGSSHVPYSCACVRHRGGAHVGTGKIRAKSAMVNLVTGKTT